jgi:hypothetical protein
MATAFPTNTNTYKASGTGSVTRTNSLALDELAVNVKNYGAKGDTRVVTDANISSGLTTLTSATAAFTAADVGKTVGVKGAGASGKALATTISAYSNSTTVTVATAAGATVNGVEARIGTDDTLAVQRVQDIIQAAGGGRMLFPAGKYMINLNTVNNTTQVYWPNAAITFSNLNGVTIEFDGASLTTVDDFTSGTNGWGFFKFTTCRNVKIEKAVVDGWGQWVASPSALQETYRRGTQLCLLHTNCTNVTIDAKISGLGYGVYSGNYADDTLGGTSNIDFTLDAYDVGYPIAMYKSGYGGKITVKAERVHRAIYLAGSRNLDCQIGVKDFDAPVAALLTGAIQDGSIASTSTTEDFCSEIKLNVTDNGCTYAPFSAGLYYLTGISPSSDAGTGTGGNLTFKINSVQASGATPGLSGFLLTSQGLTAGQYNTNLTLDNVKVTGRFDRSAVASANAGRIAVVGNGAGVGAMKLNNFSMEELVVKENAGSPATTGISWAHVNIGTNVLFRKVAGLTATSSFSNPTDTTKQYVWQDSGTSTIPTGTYVKDATLSPSAATTDLKDVLVAKNMLTDGGATPLNLDGGALTTTGTTNLGLTIVSSSVRVGTASDYTGVFSSNLQKVTPTGVSTLLFDALPSDGTSASTLRFGSVTTGTGAVNYDFYNSTSTINHRLNGRVTTTAYLCANAGNLVVGSSTDDGTNKFQVTGGDLAVTTAGRGIRVKEGSNAKMGTATLVSGEVVVSNTSVTANSRIILTVQSPAGSATGRLQIQTRTASTSFTIRSAKADGTAETNDTSTVAWMIIEPA